MHIFITFKYCGGLTFTPLTVTYNVLNPEYLEILPRVSEGTVLSTLSEDFYDSKRDTGFSAHIHGSILFEIYLFSKELIVKE